MGPVKQRRCEFTGGPVLAAMAAAQLAGEDFLVGLDRLRADAAGQQVTPVPAGHLARPGSSAGSPPGTGAVRGRPGGGDRPDDRPAARRAGRGAGRRAGDDRHRRHRRGGVREQETRGGVHLSGQRAGCTWRPGRRPRSRWPPTCWTATRTPARPWWPCCAWRWPRCRRPSGTGRRRPGRRSRCAPTPATSPGTWPAPPPRRHGLRLRRQADHLHVEGVAGIAETPGGTHRHGLRAARRLPIPSRGRPDSTVLLVRRVKLDPDQVSADPRSRRRRTLHPDQRALPIPELEQEPAIYAYSFICTNIDGPPRAGPWLRALVPAPHRHREHLP